MKKRMFVYVFIFIGSIIYFSVPNVVFGQSAQRVLDRHRGTFQHPDVHEFFPDVLRSFKSPDIQEILSPVIINLFVKDPTYIRSFDPNVDDSIVTLLAVDGEFKALFGDSEFHAVLQSSTEIEKLARLIQALEPRQREDDCETLPSKATTLSIVSEDGQEEGQPGGTLPLKVEVWDQYGDPFSGATVTFRATRGGGSPSPTTDRTDNAGQVQTYLTLGRSAGVNVVEASIAGTDTLNGLPLKQTFAATAVAPDEPRRATTLSIVSGYGQEGRPGTSLSNPFVVEVRDQYGNPFSGTNVSFRATRGDGSPSPTTAPISNGQAQTTLTLGSSPGANWVEASIAGTDTLNGFPLKQTFAATATGRIQSTVSAQLPPVYWVEGGALYYRPTGGQKTMLHKPQGGTLTGGLAVDIEQGRIYWTEKRNNNKGRIRSATLDGNDKKVRSRDLQSVPYGVTVGTDRIGNHWVYWTNSRGKIQRTNRKYFESTRPKDLENFPIETLTIRDLNVPKYIAFDAKNYRLYWAELGRIRSANPDGRKVMLVEPGLGDLGGIAVASGMVYWTEKAGNGQGKVKRENGNGSGGKLLAVLVSEPEGIAVDAEGGRLYWTTSRGEIQSTPLTGAIQTVVEGNDTRAVGLALVPGSIGSASSPAVPSASSVGSVENTLLANYPNPFNPETWIPYQLSESGNVTVSIYSVNGALVRTLALGHQAAGTYRSRNRAAYWDGRNEFGERVASGLYFYTLTAGDFTATRKMLIRK